MPDGIKKCDDFLMCKCENGIAESRSVAEIPTKAGMEEWNIGILEYWNDGMMEC